MLDILSVLFLGFILGIRHSFDSDHLVAVANLVSKTKSLRKSVLQGLLWGLGHTTTLLIVGIFVLVFSLTISKNMQLLFELIVGSMIIILGISTLIELRRGKIHLHSHKYGKSKHTHFHSYIDEQFHEHPHSKSVLYRPLAVGVIHGLAGSSALMILILSTINSLYLGILYIAFFGIGSIISMSGISALISLPLLFSEKIYQNLNKGIRIFSAIGGIAFGVYYITSLFI